MDREYEQTFQGRGNLPMKLMKRGWAQGQGRGSGRGGQPPAPLGLAGSSVGQHTLELVPCCHPPGPPTECPLWDPHRECLGHTPPGPASSEDSQQWAPPLSSTLNLCLGTSQELLGFFVCFVFAFSLFLINYFY